MDFANLKFVSKFRHWLINNFRKLVDPEAFMGANLCRGTSLTLFKELKKHKETEHYIKKMQIVNGNSHTFMHIWLQPCYYKTDKPESESYIIVDGAISQFIRKFNQIFIGSEKDLQILLEGPNVGEAARTLLRLGRSPWKLVEPTPYWFPPIEEEHVFPECVPNGFLDEDMTNGERKTKKNGSLTRQRSAKKNRPIK